MSTYPLVHQSVFWSYHSQQTCVHFSRGPLSFSRWPTSITHIPVRLALPVLHLFVASSVSSVVFVLHVHLFYRGSTFRILCSSFVEHHTAVRLLFTALHFCWKRLERKEQFHCLPLFIYLLWSINSSVTQMGGGVKVNQSHYRPVVPRGFQEVKFPRLRGNGPEWW